MKEEYLALAAEQTKARRIRSRERDSFWQQSCAARSYHLRTRHLARMFAKGTPYHLVEQPRPMTWYSRRMLAKSVATILFDHAEAESPSELELIQDVETWMPCESQSSSMAA